MRKAYKWLLGAAIIQSLLSVIVSRVLISDSAMAKLMYGLANEPQSVLLMILIYSAVQIGLFAIGYSIAMYYGYRKEQHYRIWYFAIAYYVLTFFFASLFSSLIGMEPYFEKPGLIVLIILFAITGIFRLARGKTKTVKTTAFEKKAVIALAIVYLICAIGARMQMEDIKETLRDVSEDIPVTFANMTEEEIESIMKIANELPDTDPGYD